MQSVLIVVILVLAIAILAILYGVAKTQRKEAQRNERLGSEIEKIIARNAHIEQRDWISWLQDRRDEQK